MSDFAAQRARLFAARHQHLGEEVVLEHLPEPVSLRVRQVPVTGYDGEEQYSYYEIRLPEAMAAGLLKGSALRYQQVDYVVSKIGPPEHGEVRLEFG